MLQQTFINKLREEKRSSPPLLNETVCLKFAANITKMNDHTEFNVLPGELSSTTCMQQGHTSAPTYQYIPPVRPLWTERGDFPTR